MGYFSCRANSSVSTVEPRQSSSAGGATAAARRYPYDDLAAATSNFSPSTLLGRGSHGAVYKAVLPSGLLVAVKRPSSRRLPADVDNEISILSSIRSPRIVNLLGVSSGAPRADATASDSPPPQRLLVVEFMPNGTLFDLLHSNSRPPGWGRRMRFALQIAKAIRTLHSADPPVIHRDVKSANVLLDADSNARLGDFGLALRAISSTGGSTASRATPPPAGTLGYLDPSYVTPEGLSTKADVFSFGILLLEIVSGRKAIDVAHSPSSVVEWAVPLLRRGKVAALFDPRIPLPRNPDARRQLAVLAASCVRSSRDKRPAMGEVVEQLTLLCRTVSSRSWNGLAVVANPCSVIDTERTIMKLSQLDATAGGHFPIADDGEDAETNAAEDNKTLLVATPVKKPARPLRNTRVFSEEGTRSKRDNLMQLMARLDVDESSKLGIRWARAEPVRHDCPTDGDNTGAFDLRKNDSAKDVGSESMLPPSDNSPSSVRQSEASDHGMHSDNVAGVDLKRNNSIKGVVSDTVLPSDHSESSSNTTEAPASNVP